MIDHKRKQQSGGVVVFPCLVQHNTTAGEMKIFGVFICVFLTGINGSQGRTCPEPLPTTLTDDGALFPGRQQGNECRRIRSNKLSAKPRIVGGTEAEKHEFPWQVLIYVYDSKNEEYKVYCGGSVINEWWILTAAHCVTEKMKIVAGEHDLDVVEDEEQSRKVEAIISHPEYDPDIVENDIALLKLEEKLKLDGKTVAPISLPIPFSNSTGDCVVAGWGTAKWSGELPNILNKVTVPIVPDDECREKYQRFHEKVTGRNLCAGLGGKGSCRGDSGGGLVCQRENNEAYVAGVGSWNYYCSPKYPTVYTKVSYFVDWINKVMNQE